MTTPSTLPGKLTPVQKSAQMRIQRHLARPGAVGMKGFLLWTEAAWPPAISQKILKAAQKYTPGASTVAPAGSAPTSASPAYGGFGYGPLMRFAGMGFLGDDSGITVDIPDIAGSVTQAISDANAPEPSAVTSATPSQPAGEAWIGDIANAVGAATTAYLGVQQVKDAQTIFNTNLMRAQQGLPMLPTNPTQYGLPAPTAQVGLTSSASNTLLVTVGLLAGGLILAGALGGRSRK